MSCALPFNNQWLRANFPFSFFHIPFIFFVVLLYTFLYFVCAFFSLNIFWCCCRNFTFASLLSNSPLDPRHKNVLFTTFFFFFFVFLFLWCFVHAHFVKEWKKLVQILLILKHSQLIRLYPIFQFELVSLVYLLSKVVLVCCLGNKISSKKKKVLFRFIFRRHTKFLSIWFDWNRLRWS